MSERIMTPGEEIIAKNERLYNEFRNVKTAEGAFWRLTHEFNSAKLSLMLLAETENGISYDEMVAVLGQVIGNLMIAAAGSGPEPRECLHELWAMTGSHICRLVDGQSRGTVVQIVNGHQDEMTIQGLFQETGGGSHA